MRHNNSRHVGVAGGKIVAGRTSLKDGAGSGGVEATHELVKRAEAKLVGMQANRSQLRRRIRALHYLLKTINTEIPPLESADPAADPAAQNSNIDQDQLSEIGRGLGAAVSSRTEKKETTTSGSTVAAVSTELRRACRIALMESDRPQCCEQILQRIRRRESICIEGFSDPMFAVSHELRSMLADGEVIQKKDNQLWQLDRDSGRFVAQRNFARK